MNLESLLGTIARTALSSRSKRHKRASSFFGFGRGSFFSMSKILTATALGVGAYEIWRTQKGAQAATSAAGTPPAPQPATAGLSTPPPVPRSAPVPPGVSALDPAARAVGLMLAAARADGELDEREYGKMLGLARESQAEREILRELEARRSLEELTAGVADLELRRDLYCMCFGIVRADESVSPAERIWLARLAALFELDPTQTAALEREVEGRIEGAT